MASLRNGEFLRQKKTMLGFPRKPIRVAHIHSPPGPSHPKPYPRFICRSDFAARVWHLKSMGAMQSIFRDKLTATAVAVMLVYLFLLQAFVAGMTQGAMAASVADPLHVICTTDSVETPSDPTGSTGKGSGCPCAALCNIAGLAAPAVLGGQDHVYLTASRAEPTCPRLALNPFTPPLRGFVPGPRAPPLLS